MSYYHGPSTLCPGCDTEYYERVPRRCTICGEELEPHTITASQPKPGGGAFGFFVLGFFLLMSPFLLIGAVVGLDNDSNEVESIVIEEEEGVTEVSCHEGGASRFFCQVKTEGGVDRECEFDYEDSDWPFSKGTAKGLEFQSTDCPRL